MDKSTSLLGFIAQRYTNDLEDVATDALCFILSHSISARRALSEFLKHDCEPLPIAKALSQEGISHGAFPDLALHDDDDSVVAFIESKFWAQLTPHQPVTYWRELPHDRSTVLLFLAPAWRIDHGSLWDELVDRLRDEGHKLGPANRLDGLIAAPSIDGQRRLVLTSWKMLLDCMAERTKKDGDSQACFEIAELQELAASAVAGDNPRSDENLRSLVREAVQRVEQSGWASTDRLTAGEGHDYYARYLRLAGASAGLLIHYEAAKQLPDKLLWLWFWRDRDTSVGVEEVRSRLGRSVEPGLAWLSKEVCAPIALPTGADRAATLDAIVSELERIAKLIDPDGPTYREGL